MGIVNTMGIIFPRKLDLVTGPRKKKQKTTNPTNSDGGVSEEEELVHAGDKDCPDETDHPSTEGRRWHRGIICVGNGRTDFWIWGFILKHGGRWVKVWVVVVIAHTLCVLRNNVSGGSALEPMSKGNK